MNTHELKSWPEYFQATKSGVKTFDIRKNDRDYKVGDILILKEWKPSGYSDVSPNEITGEYTGEELEVEVTYIFKQPSGANFGLIGDTVVMSVVFHW
jgi:hypothetical protein